MLYKKSNSVSNSKRVNKDYILYKKGGRINRKYAEGGSPDDSGETSDGMWVKTNPDGTYTYSAEKPANSSNWFWAEGRKLANIRNNRVGKEGTVKGAFNYSSTRPEDTTYYIDEYGNYRDKKTNQVLTMSRIDRDSVREYDPSLTSVETRTPVEPPKKTPPIQNPPIEQEQPESTDSTEESSDKSSSSFNEKNRGAFNTWTSSDKSIGGKKSTILTKKGAKTAMRQFRENINPIKDSNLWMNNCTGQHGCLAFIPPINILAQVPDLAKKIQLGVQRIGEDKKLRSSNAFRDLAQKAKAELTSNQDPSTYKYNVVTTDGTAIPKFKLSDDFGRKLSVYNPATGQYEKMSGSKTASLYKQENPNFNKKK